MNAKQAKRLRQLLRPQFAAFGMTERAAVHQTDATPSRRYSVTIQERGGIEFDHAYPTGRYVVYREFKHMPNMALQVRLMVGCPRQQYRKIKHALQANRSS